jgi:hypothetical protein
MHGILWGKRLIADEATGCIEFLSLSDSDPTGYLLSIYEGFFDEICETRNLNVKGSPQTCGIRVIGTPGAAFAFLTSFILAWINSYVEKHLPYICLVALSATKQSMMMHFGSNRAIFLESGVYICKVPRFLFSHFDTTRSRKSGGFRCRSWTLPKWRSACFSMFSYQYPLTYSNGETLAIQTLTMRY